jgi:ribonuclease BN (tRNA processing enzyme)
VKARATISDDEVVKVMRLSVLGSGDAMGSGGKHAPAFVLSAGQRHLLIDCGPGALPAFKARGLDPSGIHGILISHFHGDHFGGIPYFFLDFQFLSERSEPIRLIGPRGLKERFEALMRSSYPDVLESHTWRFAQEYHELLPDQVLEYDDVRVETYEMEHTAQGLALGFRTQWQGITVGYTGDTRWNDRIPQLARGCDLFLSECFSFNRNQPIHICYQDLLEHESEIDAKRTLLFHLGPDMLDNLSRVDLEVAKDGMIIDLSHQP